MMCSHQRLGRLTARFCRVVYRDHAYGTADCPDDTQSLRNLEEKSRADCCDNRGAATCTWLQSVLSDANCQDAGAWKGAFWTHVSAQLVPVIVALGGATVVEVRAVRIVRRRHRHRHHHD